MTDFTQYLKRGLIKKQSPDFRQIEKQIYQAEKDLEVSTLLLHQDTGWAATVAYQSMLRAGRALLFSCGYLPADGQQHKTVVEITGRILGEDFDLVVQQFEKSRRKRNIFFYDSMDSSTLTEAKKAAESAKALVAAIKLKISELNPQLKFVI